MAGTTAPIRAVGTALVMALALTACTGGDEPSDASATQTEEASESLGRSDEPSPTEESAEDAFDAPDDPPPLVVNRLENDGFLDTQAAVDLFAATYGPVPGADPARFEPDQSSVALRNIARVFDELTEEQQAAVSAVMDAPDAGQALGSTPTVRYADTRAQAATTDASLDAMVEEIRTELSVRLGRRMTWPVDVVRDWPFSRPTVHADASPMGGGRFNVRPFDTCRIRLASDPGELRHTLTHEMYHCFQFQMAANWSGVPDWVIEGQAAWVAARVVGLDRKSTVRYANWLNTARRSLYVRSYDAIGFYWAIEQAGKDPWAVMPEMLISDHEDAVAATGLTPAEAAMWIGSTNGRYEVPLREITSPYWRLAASDGPPRVRRAEIDVRPGRPYHRQGSVGNMAGVGAHDFYFEDGDVVDVLIVADTGVIEFLDHQPITFEGELNRRFCIRDGGCCPNGSEEPADEGSDRLLVAVGGTGSPGYTLSVSVADEGDGPSLADGVWTGTASVSRVEFGNDDVSAEGDFHEWTMSFEVVDGLVTSGEFTVPYDARVDMAADTYMEGLATLQGVMGGCATSPSFIGQSVAIDGTMTDRGETFPFNMEFPFDDPGTGPGFWSFETNTPTRATGSFDSEAGRAFMRGVGRTVNDGTIRFEVTRTS